MAFFAPYMLWGVLAGGIPVALHFFYRSRYRTVPWAAMKFLLTSVEQTSRRLRFQELILLVLRVAVLVLLALALARPKSAAERGSAQGDAVDAVFVIDTSYSMGARDGPVTLADAHGDPYLTALKNLASEGVVTRLARAKAAALAVLDSLPPHSTVQVIGSADRAALLGPRAPSHLDQARRVIEDLQVTHLATDFLPGITEANAALGRGQALNQEVYLFSDMQKLGWESQAGPLVEQLNQLGRRASVYLVRCATRTPQNVAVVDIAPPPVGIPHTGERAAFTVLVRNRGAEPVRNLTASLEVDGRVEDRDTQQIPLVAPGETRAVSLSGLLDRPGLRVLTASVKADDLDADNRFDRVLHVRDRVRILVVDGAPNDREPWRAGSFFLMHSLVPVEESSQEPYHVQPVVVPARQATPRILADKDLCILVNAGLQGDDPRRESLGGEFVEALAGFVRDGHGLIVYGGSHVTPEAYNQVLYQQQGLLPLPLTENVVVPEEKAFRPDRKTAADLPFLHRFRDDKAFETFNDIAVWGALGVDEASRSGDPEGARVLLRYDNGRPALVSRRVGAGEVMLVTTSADTTWTLWPAWPGTVAFLDQMLVHLLQRQTQGHNRVAGERLQWRPPEAEAAKAFALLRPDQRRVRLGTPDAVQGRPLVTAADTWRAGVYRLVPAEGERAPEGRQADERQPPEDGVPFAVVPDLRESEDLTSLTDGQIDERLDFRPTHLLAGDEPGVFSGGERLNREWTVWLLAVLLALTLLETLWAWLCGRAW